MSEELSFPERVKFGLNLVDILLEDKDKPKEEQRLLEHELGDREVDCIQCYLMDRILQSKFKPLRMCLFEGVLPAWIALNVRMWLGNRFYEDIPTLHGVSNIPIEIWAEVVTLITERGGDSIDYANQIESEELRAEFLGAWQDMLFSWRYDDEQRGDLR